MVNFIKRPSKSAYDYIIIGSGSAGSVLAARLAEKSSVRVLLVEAGPSDRSVFIQMPAAMGIPLMKDKYNWKFFSQKEPAPFSEEGIYAPRGRVFGGSSAINGMNWVRGNSADYDGWAEEGLENWSYADCLPYFKRSENYAGGGDFYRGDRGPTKVVRAEATNPLFQLFLDAAAEMGAALNPDHNGAVQEGTHHTQRNVADGIRHSASQAYIYDRPLRSNLEIMLETHCTSIEFSGKQAVRVHLKRRGSSFSIDVGKELILSAGALQSPQLLMLSGIGDADMLKSANIPIIQHMPGVGANLQDHVAWCLEYGAVNPKDSLASKLSPLGRLKIGVEWMFAKRGLGISNHFEVGAFMSVGKKEAAPNIQMECIAMRGDFTPEGVSIEPGYQCFVSIQRPTSRGKVWIDSADPEKAPSFRFNYLQTKYDKATALAAIRATQTLFSQTAWDGRLTPELSGTHDAKTDADIMNWAYAHAESNYHPCGTCAMGNGDEAVTDAHAKVHGLENLRVVDASIIPRIPTANLNAPTIMVAEKISDNILGKPALRPIIARAA